MADRLKKLKDLEAFLLACMDEADPRTVAPIAKQYRETIREIEEMEGATGGQDAISEILKKRRADGKADTVR